jgi:hypothetical protein
MTSPFKILWINQQDDIPIDGLMQFNDKKVWFSRVAPDRYDLYILDPEALKEIEIEHEVLCTKLNLPLYHGDPYVMRSNTSLKSNSENITIYNRIINPKLVKNDYLMTIDKSQFSNYLVPHRIIF